MIVYIISVRHTGTKFTKQRLFRLYSQYHIENVTFNDNCRRILALEGNWIIHQHFGNRYCWSRRFPDFPIVVPLRELWKIICSWERRNQSLIYDERGKPTLLSSLTHMLELTKQFDFNFLPIDSQSRNEYLNKLNKRLGLDLITDWCIFPESSYSVAKEFTREDVVDVRAMSQLYDSFGGFFRRFGYE